MQEATSGNIVTATGITAKFTGTSVERDGFAKAMGVMGKPLDMMNNMVGDAMGGVAKAADVGGVKKLKEDIVEHIGDEYVLLSEFQRGEVVLYVFVRKDLAWQCRVCDVQGENVGFGSIMANKCGIATQICIGSTKLSFLSAHLAAHEGQYKLRNENMAEILAGTNDSTITSHHSFVFGDLNYRVQLPKQSKGSEIPKEEAQIISQKLVSSKSWSQMYEMDGLRKALDNKDVLVGFETPKCKFPPTFKVEKRDGVHYNFKRIPSYTDRILYKSNEETRWIEPIIYEAVTHFTSSDHKPVRGLFFLPSRPHLNLDRLKNHVLKIEISNIQCRALKHQEGLLGNDNDSIDSFVRVRCEPTELVKTSIRNKFHTSTVKNSDRPFWKKEVIKFSVNVTSKELLYGSFVFFESIQENLVAGNSVVGTSVLDFEQLVRDSIDIEAEGISVPLSFELLRYGNCVGKLTCDLTIDWGNGASSSDKKQSTNSSHSTGIEKGSCTAHTSDYGNSEKVKKPHHKSTSAESGKSRRLIDCTLNQTTMEKNETPQRINHCSP